MHQDFFFNCLVFVEKFTSPFLNWLNFFIIRYVHSVLRASLCKIRFSWMNWETNSAIREKERDGKSRREFKKRSKSGWRMQFWHFSLTGILISWHSTIQSWFDDWLFYFRSSTWGTWLMIRDLFSKSNRSIIIY